jgi:hypothetical protein
VETFIIGSQSARTLTPIQINGIEMGDDHSREGKVALVRIAQVVRGPKKVRYLMFIGKLGSLELDPNTYEWKGGEALLSFTTTLGRKMLRMAKPRVNIVEKRWSKLLLSSFKLRWANTWSKMHSKKEVGFIWVVWNKAVVVNL